MIVMLAPIVTPIEYAILGSVSLVMSGLRHHGIAVTGLGAFGFPESAGGLDRAELAAYDATESSLGVATSSQTFGVGRCGV